MVLEKRGLQAENQSPNVLRHRSFLRDLFRVVAKAYRPVSMGRLPMFSLARESPPRRFRQIFSGLRCRSVGNCRTGAERIEPSDPTRIGVVPPLELETPGPIFRDPAGIARPDGGGSDTRAMSAQKSRAHMAIHHLRDPTLQWHGV